MIATAFLQQLKDRGFLDILYQEGFINHKAYLTLEVRNKVDSLMRQGLSRGRAIKKVSEEVRLTTRMIYHYL